MEEWKEYKLHEIGRIVGGATPPTKDSANYDGEISWITPKDLSNFTGRYIQKGERSITKKGFDSSSCQILPKGSFLLEPLLVILQLQQMSYVQIKDLRALYQITIS